MACWYSISTVIAAPGGMLAAEVVKMLGRSSSTRLARLPSCFACSYCALAEARSWMTPSIERSPICIRR